MKVAIYARVSTDDKGQDPVMQIEACREYCVRNKHDVIAELIDEGVTGNSWYYDRPKGRELKKLINRNSIKGIVCFAVDRFSRQNPLKLLPALNDLKDQGILFISVTEPIFNMEGSVAEPMRYMLSWFSSYFLEQHVTKVNAGMKKAAKVLCRACKNELVKKDNELFCNKCQLIVHNPIYNTKSGFAIGKPRKVDYEEILKLHKEGVTLSQIAKQLNASKSSVHNAIKRSNSVDKVKVS